MMQPHTAVAQNRRAAEQQAGRTKNTQFLLLYTHNRGGGGSLCAAKTMATFHTDEGFVAVINAASQTGQGETLGTHATPRLGGGGMGWGWVEMEDK